MKTNNNLIRLVLVLAAFLQPAHGALNEVDLQLALSSNRGSASVGDQIVYTIQYNCVSTVADGLNVVLTDQIDSNLTFVSVRNSPHVASSSYDSGNRKLTVNFISPLPAGSSGDIQITTEVSPSAVAGETIKNRAFINGSNAKQARQSNEVSVTVSGSGGGFDFSSDLRMNKRTWDDLHLPHGSVAYYIEHGNRGAAGFDVTDYVVEDIFPAGLQMDAFRTGRFDIGNAADVRTVTVKYRKQSSGAAWTVWPGSATRFQSNRNTWVSVSELGLSAGDYVTGIRMEFGTVPGGGSYHPDNLSTDPIFWLKLAPGSPLIIGDVVNNCAFARGNGGALEETSCVDVDVKAGEAEFMFWDWDSSNSAPYNPGDTIRVGATVGQESESAVAMENPAINYLLPLDFTFSGFDAAYGNATDTFGPPVVDPPIDDFAGTGRQLVRFRWPGVTLPAPGYDYRFDIYFFMKVDDDAPYGRHRAELFSGWTSPDGAGRGWMVTDDNDYDGDGSTTDKVAKDTSDFQVGNPGYGLAVLNAEKWVKGELDTAYSKYPATGLTVPGGQADYRLVLKNEGGVALNNIQVIEILPQPGDSGVVDTSARGSEWGPVLISSVTAPAGATVYYSTSPNPCRDELTPGLPSGCEDPQWSTSLPGDITSVRSLKFDFGSYWLMPGAETIIEWPMRAPLDAPTGGEIAWSSFGIIARRADNSVKLLPTEPIKVGIAIQEPEPPFFGDFVWNDLNRNGIQEAGEPGVNGVRVELYEDNGDGVADPATDTLFEFTLTLNDGTTDGKYLFSSLPVGNYFAAFRLPAGFTASPVNETSEDLDSDGIMKIVSGQALAVTEVTTITALEEDFTWDLGIYDKSLLPLVNAIAETANGQIIIGGKFSRSHGLQRNNIARLNVNGAVDTSFDPGDGFNGIVNSIAVRPDGKILVGGEFTSYDGTGARGLILLNNDGSVALVPAQPNTPSVRWVGCFSDNRMVVGGDFTSLSGGGGAFVSVLQANGSVDSSFSPSPGPDGPVHSGAVYGSEIYIGGTFGTCNGENASGIAKLHQDGSTVADFDPGTGADGPVNSVTVKNGNIFVVGDFGSFNGHAVNGAARLSPSGIVDVTFGASELSVSSNKASQ